jgi:hypothetical protein
MLRTMLYGCLRRSLPVALSGVGLLACANRGKTPNQGDMILIVGGGDDSGAGGLGGADASTPPGDDGGGGIVIEDSSHGGADACQHFDVQFLPKIPLVYVLADRSGSMFQQKQTADGGSSDEWTPLRAATLAVVQALDSQVAFGFGAYTGINPNTLANMCPILPTVPIALHNYPNIALLYNSLGQPTFKAETPAQKSLEMVAQSLAQAAAFQADAGSGQPGGEYILYVTDSETDFCDDGNPVCPADAVIAELEKLHSQGIQTMILGIDSNVSAISAAVLQSFANAGAGLPALAPPGGAQQPPLLPGDIYNQCSSVTGWNQLFTAAGLHSGQALGTYAPSASNATVYSPDATNVMDLTNKIATALNTVKSCSFDLQNKIKVDLPNAGKGHVSVDGTPVPYDPTNGWTMASPTQLDLVGTACDQWRRAGMNISFDFPCEIIITVAK